ncbi:MAG TPA: transglycosylase domain-containing protein [Geminicoccaceae bacterium]|nr:transglycosylase domain-containing protein [Geminicoccaceae bacterium]
MKRHEWRRAAAAASVFGGISTLAFGLVAEVHTSWLQAELLSSFARQLTFTLEPGPSPSIRFPASGPYDLRLGYVDLPRLAERARARGLAITQQARLSESHRKLIDRGGFPIFREKTQAGLTLVDHEGAIAFASRQPERVYPDFASIPPLIVDSLLFVEHRELLDGAAPRRNPAVEWNRLVALLPGAVARLADPERKVAGGSTLATQMEKYRHAPLGRTDGFEAKLRQIIAASLRAYSDGPETAAVRRQIVVDYLNSTPLSARARFGEVNGLGDGLWAWFGTDFAAANRALREPAAGALALAEKGRVFKQVLSLLLAQRRPSYYLIAGRADLARLTDSHLRLLRAAGDIEAGLAEAALAARLDFLPEPPATAAQPYADRKAANAIRAELLSLLDVPSLYRLDRLDLTVATSLDLPSQRRVSEQLRRLSDPEVARELGLYGHRLLDAGTPSAPLITSLTLYERGDGVNYLRVQADNLEQPFDMNQGAKLDLGSTAKLRTLITYLEIVAELYERFAERPASDLKADAAAAPDPLTQWAAGRLAASAERSLPALLEAAMQRRYSASPWEGFFTGGGLHRFENFNADHNGQVLSVGEAFRDSVNLVFVRLMRDIVAYVVHREMPWAAAVVADPHHPRRRDYLERFADREGREFLSRFYTELAGSVPDEALDRVAAEVRPRAERLAVLFRSLRPEAGRDALGAFLSARLAQRTPGAGEIDRLFERYAIERFSLNDRAYLAGIHPLKLWLAAHLQQYPDATRAAVLAASEAERQSSYAWLFKTRHKSAQDKRIRILLEEQAFARIHAAWQRLGYPFDHLVPSYATAIGTSADRPEALAELIGIVLNHGIRQPTVRIERLHFAAGTPYETVLEQRPTPTEKVVAPEIAAVVHQALIDVVEKGTARRLDGAFATSGGAPIRVGAKTGTGDHRRKSFARGGRLIDAKVVNRTATVVFFIGDAFFGNLTVFAPGPDAADFSFTSSLSAQLLKALAPALQPLLDRNGIRTAEAPPVGGA